MPFDEEKCIIFTFWRLLMAFIFINIIIIIVIIIDIITTHPVAKSAFHWDDWDQDRWPRIARIMVHQRNPDKPFPTVDLSVTLMCKNIGNER